MTKLVDLNKMTTTYSFRLSIADAIRLENGEELTIRIKGIDFTVRRSDYK